MTDQHRHRDQRGFTLLEIVLTLVILGVLGSMAGVGILQVVKGFVFSQANVEAAGKAQLAILRLERELTVIEDITASSPSSLTFVALHPDPTTPGASVKKTYTVTQSGNTVTMNDTVTTDVLVDGVVSMGFAYLDSYDDTTPGTSWGPTSQVIQVSLTVTAADNQQVTYTIRAVPRNI